MSVLDDLGTLLQSGGVGTLGTDLFLGSRPDAPVACVTIYETGGYDPIEGYGPSPMDFLIERPSVQIVARSENYADATTKARLAYRLLHGYYGTPIDTRYLGIKCQAPFKIGTDPNHKFLVGFNANILKAPPP